MRKTWVSLILFGFWSSIALANGVPKLGNEGANAGDTVAQEASALILEVVDSVEQSQSLFREVSVGDLRAIQQRVRILAPERTFVDGIETDAKNNGQDIIEINRTRWTEISSGERARKLAIVFHELLNIAGIEIGSYHISSRLLKLEFNFTRNQKYYCRTNPRPFSDKRECWLTMKYDLTSMMFSIDTGDCYSFQTHPHVFFKKKDGRGYFSYPEQQRLIKDDDNSYGFLWNEMIVTGDRAIFFLSRDGAEQMTCKPW